MIRFDKGTVTRIDTCNIIGNRLATMNKIILIGECNPYGANPYYALYPAPSKSAGYRLCNIIMGMRRKNYLDTFERINLVYGNWSIKKARDTAKNIKERGQRLILFGSKVSSAFDIPFMPFSKTESILILPHPSGLCRLWNDPSSITRARSIIIDFEPTLSELIGQCD